MPTATRRVLALRAGSVRPHLDTVYTKMHRHAMHYTWNNRKEQMCVAQSVLKLHDALSTMKEDVERDRLEMEEEIELRRRREQARRDQEAKERLSIDAETFWTALRNDAGYLDKNYVGTIEDEDDKLLQTKLFQYLNTFQKGLEAEADEYADSGFTVDHDIKEKVYLLACELRDHFLSRRSDEYRSAHPATTMPHVHTALTRNLRVAITLRQCYARRPVPELLRPRITAAGELGAPRLGTRAGPVWDR